VIAPAHFKLQTTDVFLSEAEEWIIPGKSRSSSSSKRHSRLVPWLIPD
jgi:hypothetical protein